jgi:hypothetical protein
LEEALKYFLMAAHGGDVDAMVEAANFYQRIGSYKKIHPDLEKAAYWYEMAAGLGSSFAACELGFIYRDGIGRPVDKQKAFEYFLFAASDEILGAYIPLADCLINGEGVEQDHVEALDVLHMFWQCLDKRYPDDTSEWINQYRGEMHYRLGLLHDIGVGVNRSAEKAYRHYALAGEFGHTESAAEAKKFRKGLFGWKKVEA